MYAVHEYAGYSSNKTAYMKLVIPDIVGTLEVYLDCLNAIIGEQRGSMLDVGCCFAPNTPTLGFKKRKYVDVIERKLDHKSEQKYFTKADALQFLEANEEHFDVTLSLDHIEHLEYGDGLKLLHLMKCNSSKQVVFTPTTALFGYAKDGDKDPECHRSLWSSDWLEETYTGEYAYIIFPDYHKVWNSGAFFFFSCHNLKQEFERVITELKTKHWYAVQ